LLTNPNHALGTANGEICVSLKEVEYKQEDINHPELQPGRYAELSVSDTGCGISPAVIDKIFDPYFTTKDKERGTGLGLSLVYGIVREYGGDVRVRSEIGKGSRFDVLLPILLKPEQESMEDKTEYLPSGTERILLVDDEASIVRLEKMMLERLGYQTSSCTSSTEALELFKASPDYYDIVVTDMTMPNMTGDVLAREIRAVDPHIPVIVCTGFSERVDQNMEENSGIKAFLKKPVTKLDLAETVRKVLDDV
ncbi:MAG: response regulator, partial [Desulfobacteraceae bacterium]